MKIKNKKLLLLLVVIVIIIVSIALIIIFRNKQNKDNKDYFNMEPSVSQEKSEIDMNNLTNSKIAEDGLKVNTSEKIFNGIEFNDLKITNIKIEASEGVSIFNAKVENTLNKDLKGYLIYLIFLDENSNEIARIETSFTDITKGNVGYITATTKKDIAIAYELKIERK